ncbi:hypothetical protein DPMN_108210 [Dreissena polymorpha]|uniref:Pacifastin domain-containing protein n=1 Tax=Dreissena polymorpha TaxID=45954 RepID=A0A9D4K839_DREPO|nr:hypothetical protein DPMN_108210 [Dreissena polymorpha]
MHKFAICLCLFFGCLAFTQAQILGNTGYYGRQRQVFPQVRYCYDFVGRPVTPGQQYSNDGCNTCRCGYNGQGACTLMACNPSIRGHREGYVRNW